MQRNRTAERLQPLQESHLSCQGWHNPDIQQVYSCARSYPCKNNSCHWNAASPIKQCEDQDRTWKESSACGQAQAIQKWASNCGNEQRDPRSYGTVGQ